MRFGGLFAAVRARRWAGAATAGAVATGGVVVVALTAAGHPAQDPELLSGAAWLPSSGVGQLTLLDGASAEVAAQVKVAEPGENLDAIQQGAHAYSVNRTTGDLRRIDGATFDLTEPQSPLPDATSGLTAFATENTVYTLDTDRGVLVEADPQSLQPDGEPVSLAARITDGAAALDETGRLWILDNATGDLVRVADGARTTHRGRTGEGDGRLTIANGAPVLVNTTTRTATTLDPDSSDARNTVDLDLRPGDTTHATGSTHADRLYLTTRGVLLMCELDGSGCDDVVSLGAAANDLGPAVESGNRVFVPDYTTGQVWIIDLGDTAVVAEPAVMDPPAPFQLLNHDGVIFYNDPNTERAGIVDLDGTVTPIAKYNPDDPDQGLTNPANPTTSNAPPDERDEGQQDQDREREQDEDNEPGEQPTGPPDDPSTVPPPSPPTGQPNPTPPTGQPSTPPGQPSTPPTTTPTPNPPPTGPTDITQPLNLDVTMSDTTPAAHQDITLQVRSAGGDTPTTATWSFGDGNTGNGDTVTHAWTAENTYQVSVQATMPDGRTGSTSLGVTVEARTIRLLDLSPSATWRTGAGAIPFGGSDTDDRGFALFRDGPYSFGNSGSCTLEDGTAPRYLETHPQWVDNGMIRGRYELPSEIAPGDRFRARIGFIRCANLHNPPSNHLGDVRFSVLVSYQHAEVEVFSRQDTGADGVMHDIDVDLSPHVGARAITLRVEATSSSQQAWASWVAPRIEGG